MGHHPHAVLRHFANSVRSGTSAERADNRTSMADARTGICLAAGVAINDIDPATGYDISARAYQNVRQSWVTTIRLHGWCGDYRPESDLPDVFAAWVERRPDLTVDDSADAWLQDGADAHLQHWDARGLACNRPSCILHDPA